MNLSWSIGYQHSKHPLKWNPQKAKVYSICQAHESFTGLADPFIIQNQGQIFLFCEVMLKNTPNAKIGVSLYNQNKDQWDFLGIVLDEPFHLSYPYVFTHGKDIYMVPETKQAKSIRLYKATSFPSQWKLEKILINNRKFVDPSLLILQNKYYLFATRQRRLYLYVADSLTGVYTLHPKSPVKRWNYGRCAGRIIFYNDSLYRFAQEQAKGYGNGVHVFKIVTLTPEEYKEIPVNNNPLFKPFGHGWAYMSMHHIDVLDLDKNHYFAVFDGEGFVGEHLKSICRRDEL